ncbi:FecCD family ABC transporter permease [Salinispira pacifica]|uniref:ABC-type Fe3+-siderophore transport system, permease 2 component n=1 Tax=Salinispira pacifica TaxID=1307761 RepID=V5WKC3_9SPIO|nr:iron ABC transporter permease [Salinispira pacifica]AHC16085.1 hypothetical protein L21SP2_2733 [Salinispira pacifica]
MKLSPPAEIGSSLRRARFLKFGSGTLRVFPLQLLWIFGLMLLLGVLGLVALSLGDLRIGLGELFQALAGKGSRLSIHLVRELRLSRITVAVLAGVHLAAAGHIFQVLIRNPLASPDIIGITAGASAAAVAWLVNGGSTDLAAVPASAGALSASALVYVFSRTGAFSENRLVLVGVGVNAALTALVQLFIVSGSIHNVSRAYQWLAGSLYASSWQDARFLLISGLVLIPPALYFLIRIRPLVLGSDAAETLGVRLEFLRYALLILGSLLSAMAVSLTGPIGFLALMVPQLARGIMGGTSSSSAVILPVAMLLGGVMLLGSDIAAQHLFPVSIPVGLITAAVGAPYFLMLLRRRS